MIGATASGKGEPLFSIIARSEYDLIGLVPTADLPDLKVEQTARIKVIGAGELDGKVTRVAPTVEPNSQLGQVTIAVTSNKRLAAAPDIPTVDEAGAPGVYISTWYGLWVPKGTPPEAIRRLAIAAMDALVDPTVRQRLSDLGQEIPPPEEQTAEALAAHQKAEIEKWWPLIKAANIKAE